MKPGIKVWPDRAKVLVIDDEKGMRNLLSKVLTREGYDVLTAEGGERALEIVRADEVDLALVDLKMPGIGGMETIRRIKEINKGIALIIITAFGEMRSVKEATKLGVFDYLTKPLDMDYVRALVKHVLVSTRPRSLPFAEDLKKKFTGRVEIAPKQEVMRRLSILKQDVEERAKELKTDRRSLARRISPRKDRIMAVKEVAEYLGVHVSTIYKCARDGGMPAFKLGGQWRFKKDLLDKWILAKTNQNNAGK